MTITTDQLRDILGPVGYREYEEAQDWAKPKLQEWARTLRDLSDDDFRGEAASAIHGSALTNSWRGNWNHEDCKASAAHHEANRRHRAAGHSDDCRGDTIYDRAFAQVWRSQGHSASAYPVKPCTCGAAR